MNFICFRSKSRLQKDKQKQWTRRPNKDLPSEFGVWSLSFKFWFLKLYATFWDFWPNRTRPRDRETYQTLAKGKKRTWSEDGEQWGSQNTERLWCAIYISSNILYYQADHSNQQLQVEDRCHTIGAKHVLTRRRTWPRSERVHKIFFGDLRHAETQWGLS